MTRIILILIILAPTLLCAQNTIDSTSNTRFKPLFGKRAVSHIDSLSFNDEYNPKLIGKWKVIKHLQKDVSPKKPYKQTWLIFNVDHTGKLVNTEEENEFYWNQDTQNNTISIFFTLKEPGTVSPQPMICSILKLRKKELVTGVYWGEINLAPDEKIVLKKIK